MTRKLGRIDQEASVIENGLRIKLWNVAGSSGLIGLLIVVVNIAVSFA